MVSWFVCPFVSLSNSLVQSTTSHTYRPDCHEFCIFINGASTVIYKWFWGPPKLLSSVTIRPNYGVFNDCISLKFLHIFMEHRWCFLMLLVTPWPFCYQLTFPFNWKIAPQKINPFVHFMSVCLELFEVKMLLLQARYLIVLLADCHAICWAYLCSKKNNTSITNGDAFPLAPP